MTSLPISVAGGLIAGFATCAAAQATTVDLVPHRAVYDLRLANRNDGGISEMTSVTGRMVFEITGGACEPYTVNSRFVLEQTDSEGHTTLTDIRSSSVESVKGDSYDFLSQTFTNQVLVGDIKGSASADGSLRIKLVTPQDASLEIKRKVLFPTAHVARLIQAARAGKSVVEAEIFDGTDAGDKVYQATAFIGPSTETPVTGVAAGIGPVRHWPATVSYYDANGTGDRGPDYTLQYEMWENGVSTDLVMDYGDFSLDGDLSHYEQLPRPKCK